MALVLQAKKPTCMFVMDFSLVRYLLGIACVHACSLRSTSQVRFHACYLVHVCMHGCCFLSCPIVFPLPLVLFPACHLG